MISFIYNIIHVYTQVKKNNGRKNELKKLTNKKNKYIRLTNRQTNKLYCMAPNFADS